MSVLKLVIKVEKLNNYAGLDLPEYQTQDAAGLDLQAALPEDAPVTLNPMERKIIPTGLKVEIPKSHEIQIRPRSGLAVKQGITVLNTPGTIDADYRGEIGIILINLGSEPVTIKRGDRVAQMVVARVEQIMWEAVAQVNETDRGTGGFGSTGVSK